MREGGHARKERIYNEDMTCFEREMLATVSCFYKSSFSVDEVYDQIAGRKERLEGVLAIPRLAHGEVNAGRSYMRHSYLTAGTHRKPSTNHPSTAVTGESHMGSSATFNALWVDMFP